MATSANAVRALAAHPERVEGRVGRLWEEIQASREGGAGFSLSLVDGGDHVSVQPVGARGCPLAHQRGLGVDGPLTRSCPARSRGAP